MGQVWKLLDQVNPLVRCKASSLLCYRFICELRNPTRSYEQLDGGQVTDYEVSGLPSGSPCCYDLACHAAPLLRALMEAGIGRGRVTSHRCNTTATERRSARPGGVRWRLHGGPLQHPRHSQRDVVDPRDDARLETLEEVGSTKREEGHRFSILAASGCP